MNGLREASKRAGHPLLIHAMPGTFCTHFSAAEVCWNSAELTRNSDASKSTRYRALLREEGIIQGLGNRWLISFALTSDDVDDTLARAERAFQRL